jgi:hypothetical protein
MDELESSNKSSEMEVDKAFDEFMQKPTTLPSDLVITLTNFADEQDAHRCANAVRGYLEIFGRLMELGRLDLVYITFDYAGTLASLDLGTGSDTILKPTNDEIATGVAMAPSVLREDGWKSVIVIGASYARSLSYEIGASDNISKEQLDALRAETVHILAHECGHVHDHAMQSRSFPAETYKKKWTPFEYRVKEPAMASWGEYIAEFLGAGFGTKDTLSNYENAFCDRMKAAWPAVTASIRQYRMHGNIDRVISEVGIHIRNIIIYAAYMLGYLSKKDQNLETGAEQAVQTAKGHPELGDFIERIQDELHALHDQYPDFTSLDVFTPLSAVVHDMYKKAGLTFIENENGSLRVEIPHRSDTMPSVAEQVQFAWRANQAGS